MKVILLKDISKVGRCYEVKEVASGYALNFLIPRGLAKPATDSEIQKIEQLKAVQKKEDEKNVEEFKKLVESISGEKVIVESKVNEKGHLFKGLHEKDLSGALKSKRGVEVPVEKIKLEKPIKEVGDYEVEIAGPGGVNGKVIFSVVAAK